MKFEEAREQEIASEGNTVHRKMAEIQLAILSPGEMPVWGERGQKKMLNTLVNFDTIRKM